MLSLNLKEKFKAILNIFNFRRQSRDNSNNTGNSLFEKRFQFQNELDKRLLNSLLKRRIPSLKQLKYINRFYSTKELRVIKLSFVIFFISIAIWGVNFYLIKKQNSIITEGVYIEGVVGSPRVINPLYIGRNEAENDIVHLVYSSILKRGAKGELINDLAEKIEESADGKTYTVTLRSGIKWHNFQDLEAPELTADDVLFTFNAIKNPLYKSTLQTAFIGTEIEKVEDEKNGKIKFVLATPYAGFRELLTFGILPAEIWQQIDPADAARAEASSKPIGTGPYQFNNLTKDASGRIHEFDLKTNANYFAKVSFLELKFRFFQTIDEAVADLEQGKISGIGDLPIEYLMQSEIDSNKYNVRALNYPKSTALFFNLSENKLLADIKLRKILNLATNKQSIIPNALDNYTEIINSPIPKDSFAFHGDLKTVQFDMNHAKQLLAEAGWKIKNISNEDVESAAKALEKSKEEDKASLSETVDLGAGSWVVKGNKPFVISLSVINRPAIIEIANEISRQWSAVGVKTHVNTFEVSEIGNVIKSKSFDILLYSIVQSGDPDPYIFWHSTQIANGLNITGFNNKEVDKLLEEARQINNQEQRTVKYKKFQEIINEEVPAIFLYSSKYIYIQDKKLNGQQTTNIIQPSDRLNDAPEWYLKPSSLINWKSN